MKKKKYLKPKMSNRKVKLNFFLSNISMLDQFNFIGSVYAQSSQCAGDSIGGCTGDDQCGNPACNSASNCEGY